ncbi:glycosyltransferase family 4 protein [Nocardioides sp.]|uniref:glycosyltransferase family 4 protein n=1 Tax=Nocardioides sp. TaxID=35761 RepID=UPI003514B04D
MSGRRPAVVLAVHDLRGGGGMETVLRRQLPALAERFDITVVSFTLDDALRDVVAWVPVRGPRFPAWLRTLGFWLLGSAAVARTRRRIRRRDGEAPLVWAIGGIVLQRADLVSVHFCHAGYVESVGWAVGVRGIRRLNAVWSRRISLALERWSYRPSRAGRLLAVSGGLRDEVARHYPRFPVTSIDLTPNGVDLPRDPVRPLETSGPARRALFVGGDWGRKGLAAAIEGVLGADGWSLDVVGEGPAALGPEYAARLGAGDRVRFHGRSDDVATFYRDADVLLLPSHYETFGMVVYEAAAFGVVPVTTPVHGVTDLLDGHSAGRLVAAGDPAAITRALDELADPLLLREQRSAVAAAAAGFDWEHSVAAVAAAISRAR